MLSFEGMKYSVRGEGLPILLLHGWGASSQSFAVVAGELSLDYRVYSVDLWGFGESDMPSPQATIYDYAEGIYRFIRKVIGEPTVIIGHSFGGRIGLILGSRSLVSGLVLVDSAGLKPRLSFAQKLRIRRYKRLRNLVELDRVDARKLERFGSRDYRNLPEGLRGVFVRVVNEDLAKFAQMVDKPTLILWGRSDRTTPPRMARKLCRLISGSRLVWLHGGHFSYLDSPRNFLIQCKIFLNNLEK